MTFELHAPQLLMILACATVVVWESCNHGKPKPVTKYNGVTTLIGKVILILWLWWGGFF